MLPSHLPVDEPKKTGEKILRHDLGTSIHTGYVSSLQIFTRFSFNRAIQEKQSLAIVSNCLDNRDTVDMET